MRRIIRIVSLGCVLLLAACVAQPPKPKTIAVSEERLAQLIASQFPFNSEMLEVLDVEVGAPRIALDGHAGHALNFQRGGRVLAHRGVLVHLDADAHDL